MAQLDHPSSAGGAAVRGFAYSEILCLRKSHKLASLTTFIARASSWKSVGHLLSKAHRSGQLSSGALTYRHASKTIDRTQPCGCLL